MHTIAVSVSCSSPYCNSYLFSTGLGFTASRCWESSSCDADKEDHLECVRFVVWGPQCGATQELSGLLVVKFSTVDGEAYLAVSIMRTISGRTKEDRRKEGGCLSC